MNDATIPFCTSVIDRHGSLCDYGLFSGNILDACSAGDLLIASVHSRQGSASYATMLYPNSLIAQIEQSSHCDIAYQASHAEFDMRSSLHSWMSHIKINGCTIPLVVIEMDRDMSITSIMDDLALFIEVLERKDRISNVNRVLVPMLGTGNQHIPLKDIAPAQIRAFHTILLRSNAINEICLIDIDASRAKETAELWDTVLGRGSVMIANDNLAKAVAEDLLDLIEKHLIPPPPGTTRWINNLAQALREQRVMSSTLPSICRHICESVLDTLDQPEQQNNSPKNTADRIESLYHRFGISHWMVSYLHVLRQFGNYGSHESAGKTSSLHPQLTPTDLTICLQCIRSVLSFWVRTLAEVSPTKST